MSVSGLSTYPVLQYRAVEVNATCPGQVRLHSESFVPIARVPLCPWRIFRLRQDLTVEVIPLGRENGHERGRVVLSMVRARAVPPEP
jgi:hypothetical protein